MQIRPLNIEYLFNNERFINDIFSYFGKGVNPCDVSGFNINGNLETLNEVKTTFNNVLVIPAENQNSVNIFIRKNELPKLLTGKNQADSGFLGKLENAYRNYVEYESKSFTVAGKVYPMNTFYVMGILNVTPDSFSDGGMFYNTGDAVRHGIEMYDAGVDFIDVGGESTRPGAEKVETGEEIRRVIPVIEGILSSRPEAVISIDTTKAKVADLALDVGAKIVNDISGLSFDGRMAEVAAKHDASVVLMHIKGTPQTMQLNPYYDDAVGEIYEFIERQMNYAKSYGINDIMVDPGIGFGKRIKDNYEILARLDEFKGLGMPILIGLSRKSFIGKALDIPVENRDFATLVSEQIAVSKGAVIVRTHNYKKLLEAKKINSFVKNPNSAEVANV